MSDSQESKFARGIKKILSAIRTAMYPHGYVCIECGAELGYDDRYDSLCPKCRASLPYRSGQSCPICGDYVNKPGRCSQCATTPPLFDKAYAPFEYGGIIRKIIVEYKDGDGEYLREYIVKYLTDYAKAMELNADIITCVPSLPKTVKRRGFDHMRTVAQGLADNLSIPEDQLLERLFHNRDQTKLTYDERQASVKGAFGIKSGYPIENLRGITVLLIDDVMTSRATASECARILKENGVSKVIVLTLAR